ncbi:hypothetical protein GCM10011297_07610 [Bacterioplanes sanyensis]|uniref:hypothetical protein n=1 Tax=Bacterioplanes sanyensis TaxID=1249553 RepID=UPI001671C666|nr:hypothetical protein [Bacterioplanes sanyensis]GGY37015.1 hypothetical protein GCM10011297_07610 [Bacterioplanes sanyensis]
MVSRWFFLVSILCLTGCGTLSFTQDLPDNYYVGSYGSEQWHDTTLDGMVEISEPVNLYLECQGKPWASIKTEYTFSNGLVAFVGETALSYAVPALAFVSPYTPWAYRIRCGQPMN